MQTRIETVVGKDMIVKKEWVKEFARDFIALGSLPFLILTIVRVSVIQIYYPMQFIISSILFFVLNAIFKGEMRAGIGVILLTFTSLFYNHILFTTFALLVYLGVVISLFYLGRGSRQILRGILLGMISVGIAYVIVNLVFF